MEIEKFGAVTEDEEGNIVISGFIFCGTGSRSDAIKLVADRIIEAAEDELGIDEE